jgi:hypothetical protein
MDRERIVHSLTLDRPCVCLGFLLSTDHLKSSDEQLDDTAQGFLPKSSLSGMERYRSQIDADNLRYLLLLFLCGRHVTDDGTSPLPGSFCLSAVVRGDKSLGSILQEHGFDSVPSPKYPRVCTACDWTAPSASQHAGSLFSLILSFVCGGAQPSQTPPFRVDMAYFWGAWTTRHYAQSYQQCVLD